MEALFMKYEIKGTPLPVVICEIEPGESLITEGGSMSWMTPNMVMETVSGGLGKSLGRMFSGESLFLNKYTAEGGQGMIAFASSFPGQILPVNIEPNASMVVQKSAFLASQSGVELSIHFQKKLGAGFFGGEGFIMQKLSGQGLAFIEIDGSIVDYQLAAGQTMLIDNGYLAMMDASVTMDIQTVKGLKNKLLGGEGFFLTKVTGPGRVWIQTMPISSIAKSLAPFVPNRS
jgi:uncharacterized protein (TIGR00266 family)